MELEDANAVTNIKVATGIPRQNMSFESLIRRALIALCLSTMLLAQAGADVLEYRVIYRGMFSAGADMPIADLVLETSKAQGSADLRQARIEASSLAYPLVETLFPDPLPLSQLDHR